MLRSLLLVAAAATAERDGGDQEQYEEADGSFSHGKTPAITGFIVQRQPHTGRNRWM
jgi:hypothetical protein